MASFANDGGPLIVLDSALTGEWRGVGTMADDGIPPDSDYARACDADYPAGLTTIAWASGAVIGAKEGISTAYWISLPEIQSHYLVGVVFGDEATDEALHSQLVRGPVGQWHDLGSMEIPSGRLVLLHAACGGTDVEIDPPREVALIGDALSHPVPAGVYTVSAAELALGDEGLYNVVRWRALRP